MLVVFLILLGVMAPDVTRHVEASGNKRRVITFEDRIAAQRAIEEVYWKRRIWPQDNRTPKPSLNEVAPDPVIRAKVEDYLRKSAALEFYWQRLITNEELQAEIERMAQRTKQPEALHELWAALNDDPLLISECLARPLLADRLIRELYTADERFHGELKRRAKSELNELGARGQMRRTSGEYREVDWIKGETEDAAHSRGLEINGVLRVSAAQWDEQVSKLAGKFGATGAKSEPPIEQWSGLQENEERFYAVAVVEKGADRMKVAIVSWKKVSFDEWWNEARIGMGLEASAPGSEYQLPEINSAVGPCDGDAWAATSVSGAPSARNAHVVVWTGNEMIVWGGFDGASVFNTGGRYNPATDTWTATSATGAPQARSASAGVWTGAEMVVWGGFDRGGLDTGGRYNPVTNSWRPTNSVGAPNRRASHTAVWTGNEMIIWGGEENVFAELNTGGRYNPVSDAWAPTSLNNAPLRRVRHSAVWTGNEMIVWGGFITASPTTHNTGGRYNPSTDTWTATNTTGAPESRFIHTAVWTGSEMIVWGGFNGVELNSGGRYNPMADSWITSSATGAPSARRDHSAVWTGTEMIIWGGRASNVDFNTGGRYNPTGNAWTTTATTNAPSPRSSQTAVWTGSAMIVWGGLAGSARLNTGGRYTVTSALTISPSSQSFSANGGSGVVNVSSPSGCAWTATSNASWITITSGGSGAGNGAVNYSVAANLSTSSRTGSITITGQTFTVNQAAAGGACPAVSNLAPTSSAPGASVTITGTNFTGVSAVKFANNVAASFTVSNDTQITATVPSGAVTGPITISKPNCPDAVTPVFTVGTAGGDLALTSGSPQTGSLPAPSSGGGVLGATQYTITVPAGASQLKVDLTGNQDVDLFVRFGQRVTISGGQPVADYRSDTTAPNETVTVSPASVPPLQAGTYYIAVANFGPGAANFTVTATVTASQAVELAVDDGTFEASFGLVSGGTVYAVNRLTPASYPATLSAVNIFFSATSGAKVGDGLVVLVGTNPGGGSNIDATTFQNVNGTVQSLDQFNVFTVPNVTINSGDFVVGFRITHAQGVFPIAQDKNPPSSRRSYISNTGASFTIVDDIRTDFAGNFGIRARLQSTGPSGPLANASAASYSGAELAPESIVAAFGANLAGATQSAASVPLPTTLAGTTGEITDSAGTRHPIPFFFVSPGQVNYLLPLGVALGPASVTIRSGSGAISSGTIQIARVTPGLFTANSDGQGVPAAQVFRIQTNGAQSYEPVAEYNAAQQRFIPLPINLGPETDQVFLVLYGTGIRFRSSLSAVTVNIGGVNTEVLFAGASPDYVGVDQVNSRLPRSMIGRGEVNVILTVDGKTANTVKVAVK